MDIVNNTENHPSKNLQSSKRNRQLNRLIIVRYIKIVTWAVEVVQLTVNTEKSSNFLEIAKLRPTTG